MKYFKYIFLFLIGISVVACDSDETDNLSSVTTFPALERLGDEFTIISQGTSYSDPGAVATIGDAEVPVDVTGAVDTSTPGGYKINYEATNDEGFSQSATRAVVVYDPSTDASDLSGQYTRGNGVIINISKIGESTYRADNAGGAFADGDERNLDIVFVHTSGNELVIPLQTAPNGVVVESLLGTLTADGFDWALNATAFYGTFTRNFTKI